MTFRGYFAEDLTNLTIDQMKTKVRVLWATLINAFKDDLKEPSSLNFVDEYLVLGQRVDIEENMRQVIIESVWDPNNRGITSSLLFASDIVHDIYLIETSIRFGTWEVPSIWRTMQPTFNYSIISAMGVVDEDTLDEAFYEVLKEVV